MAGKYSDWCRNYRGGRRAAVSAWDRSGVIYPIVGVIKRKAGAVKDRRGSSSPMATFATGEPICFGDRKVLDVCASEKGLVPTTNWYRCDQGGDAHSGYW